VDLERERVLAAERAPQIARAAADVERLTGELAALADVEPPPTAPDLQGPADAARAAEEALLTAHKAAAVAERALAQARTASAKIRELALELSAAEEAISDWDRVADDLGRNGLQAAEIDCAAPELTELTNDLLRASGFTRWTTRFQASRASKDGSKELDGFEALVFDATDGREADAKLFSPGEKALIGEAMANALSIVACRRAGMGAHGPTIFRDETSSGLAKEHIAPYIAMIRKVAAIVGSNKVFFISHVDEMKELADSHISIMDGLVQVSS
jgi:DNA repair exonuclease SbcCD ATPase subunit